MMLDYRTMNRLRFQPRVIETLETRIEKDREELLRVRNDLLYETQHVGHLRQRERTLVSRIESNTDRLHQLKMEVLQLRQRLAEVIS
ncbi:MAG: hypothetical protein ACYCT2_04365 [Thermoplasmataceae archaeon]